MIRVLEILATVKRAGAETMVASLVCGLDRQRFEPAVATLYDASPNDLEEQIQRCGVAVRRLGKHPGLDFRMFSRISRAISDFRPDIIHTHSYVMRYSLPAMRCPGVHTVHNLAAREVDAVGRFIHRIGFRFGVTPIAVAKEVASSVGKMYKICPAVIPNGIDVNRFQIASSKREQWREAHGFHRSDVLVISVARLEPQKNPGLLVRAINKLPSSCHLLLAGEGSLRSSLEGFDRVHLLGVRTDLPEVLAAADIFALASDWEGYPIALMEAMAAGLPVVATRVGGVPEIVSDDGLLVPPGDIEAITAALSRLAEEPVVRKEYAGRSRSRASLFDVTRMIDAYSDLFERLAHR
ncbi:MAG: glycosyltransferase [Bryobacteraceae bacterium]|nr:glycosyltransferase [Bryobacteraceae bacterium]